MSSQILQAELANLIQESKRKHSELKNAAEQSLGELKALPSTSEAQITADLIRRPHFVAPFLLACQTRQAKIAAIGAVCLQRLATSHALSPDRLGDILSALREASGLSQDVQLKILQTLPALLHNYSEQLSGELLAHTLEICATIQVSKVATVSNTAAATLQQLVISVFEKVAAEDGSVNRTSATKSVLVENTSIDVGIAAYDARLILDDLCHLVEGEKLDFLQIKGLSPVFVLELIESVLVNNIKLFRSHPEQMHVLRNRLMPLTVKHLSERHNFPQTLRITRILLILLKNFLSLLPDECEMALGLLIHLLEPDVSTAWKRVLCMEVFRGLHAEPGLIRLAYALFDQTEGRKTIVKDHMESLLRLASEKPSTIGVSHQSTVPSGVSHSRSNTEEQITLEAGGVAGVIGAAVNAADENVTGISNQWSTVRAPYLELLDKSEAPTPPETYIYSLVINCISSLSEGLAKFILPLTVTESRGKRKKKPVHDREQGSSSDLNELQRSSSTRSTMSDKKQTVPLNPLALEDHPQMAAIRSCAGIIESCWPAILATCSTFLYAALDAEFYHNLVRSFQKLTQVAGLLRQAPARDAFLATLGKATVPVDGLSTYRSASSSQQSEASDTTGENALRSPLETPKASMEVSRTSLSTRNLLCLRALLNLGIALGPTLDKSAWSILLETLQYADLVIKLASISATKQNTTTNVGNGDFTYNAGQDVTKANIGNEILAVQTVASRLFDSTAEYPNDSFEPMLKALLDLAFTSPQSAAEDSLPARHPSPRRLGRVHQTTRSISLVMGKSRLQDDELNFVLDKARDIGSANIYRLSSVGQEEDAIWDILNANLIRLLTNSSYSPAIRLKASKTLNSIILQTMKSDYFERESRNALQLRNLRSLQLQIESLYRPQTQPSAVDMESHEQALDTLKVMLEQYGETFLSGWDLVFKLISSVFDRFGTDSKGGLTAEKRTDSSLKPQSFTAKSARLVRAAYSSLQLIASDFLTLLPPSCLLYLVDSFSYFASQDADFNISLTTTTFFWNVSDYLQGQLDKFSIEESIDTNISEESLTTLTNDVDVTTSRGALWLILLLHIVGLTTDKRPEIRNSAVRTLLRIFDAYGPQLSPKAWNLCLNRVLFVMMNDIQHATLEAMSPKEAMVSDQSKVWEETAVIMIKGSSDLIATFFDPIVSDANFDSSWTRFLGFFQALVRLNTHEVVEAVFKSLYEIMKHAEKPGSLSNDAVQLAWQLWFNNHPAIEAESLNSEESNQDALLAYIRSFQQIYKLYKDNIGEEQVQQILGHLRVAVWNSVISRYSLDIDHQSSLQESVLDCTRALCRDKPETQPEIIDCLAKFDDAALTQWSVDRDRSRPSLIAFSKAAIDLSSWYVTEHNITACIFADGSLVSLLQHLAHPILRKYDWTGRDREPFIWQKATTSAINIIRVVVPYMEKQYEDFDKENTTQIWSSIVDIMQGIISGPITSNIDLSPARIAADEEFDIQAFHALKPLILPSIGSSYIPDSVRRDLSCALVRSSFIYPPQRMDKPIEILLANPLQDLYQVRRGRTFAPVPIARSKMAYALLDTMFELARAITPSSGREPLRQKISTEDPILSSRVTLSRSIMPYLILRASLPLKSYIADQPLRGRMPQPVPARRELLHTLGSLADLESEPVAIPDAPNGIVSSSTTSQPRLQYRKHLGWMYPLIVKCVHVAGKAMDRRDQRVLENLVRILDAIGDCQNLGHDDEEEE